MNRLSLVIAIVLVAFVGFDHVATGDHGKDPPVISEPTTVVGAWQLTTDGGAADAFTPLLLAGVGVFTSDGTYLQFMADGVVAVGSWEELSDAGSQSVAVTIRWVDRQDEGGSSTLNWHFSRGVAQARNQGREVRLSIVYTIDHFEGNGTIREEGPFFTSGVRVPNEPVPDKVATLVAQYQR